MPVENPVNSEQVTIIFTIDGVLLAPCAIEDFSVSDRVSRLEADVLGKDITYMRTRLRGHEGSMTLLDRDPDVHSAVAAYFAAVQTAIPTLVTIKQVLRYENGSQVTKTYKNCAIETSGNYTTGEFGRLTISWSNGDPAIVTRVT